MERLKELGQTFRHNNLQQPTPPSKKKAKSPAEDSARARAREYVKSVKKPAPPRTGPKMASPASLPRGRGACPRMHAAAAHNGVGPPQCRGATLREIPKDEGYTHGLQRHGSASGSAAACFGGRGLAAGVGRDRDYFEVSGNGSVVGNQENVQANEKDRETRGWWDGGHSVPAVEPKSPEEDIESLMRRHTLQREHVSALCLQLQSTMAVD